ncbi:hypothetical protein HanIR_Chr11g0552971 [Helianthus annuus]|nr:hypothetical protein HanIR_Chr11g0552971 [Helianthus annuus]
MVFGYSYAVLFHLPVTATELQKKTGSCHASGMNFVEALLHCFRILEPDCGPGVGVSKGFGAFIIWPIFRFSKHHLC